VTGHAASRPFVKVPEVSVFEQEQAAIVPESGLEIDTDASINCVARRITFVQEAVCEMQVRGSRRLSLECKGKQGAASDQRVRAHKLDLKASGRARVPEEEAVVEER
jgi:hypothetical protein